MKVNLGMPLLILSVLFIGIGTFGSLVKLSLYFSFGQLLLAFFIGIVFLVLAYREEDRKR